MQKSGKNSYCGWRIAKCGLCKSIKYLWSSQLSETGSHFPFHRWQNWGFKKANSLLLHVFLRNAEDPSVEAQVPRISSLKCGLGYTVISRPTQAFCDPVSNKETKRSREKWGTFPSCQGERVCQQLGGRWRLDPSTIWRWALGSKWEVRSNGLRGSSV